jgi:hypothetical protein
MTNSPKRKRVVRLQGRDGERYEDEQAGCLGHELEKKNKKFGSVLSLILRSPKVSISKGDGVL